jgi:DNA-binding MarR family transcriptional regulator
MKIDRSTLVEAARTCACFNLRKTSRAVTRVFDETLERRGLRSTGFLTLVAIHTEGSPTLPRLARILDLDRSTLTRNLRPLVEAGYVRTATRKGSRSTSARLTPSGARALERCVPLWREAQDRVEARVGKERWASLLASLSSLASIAPGSRAG